MEQWKPVVGYENLFSVSENGKVLSLRTGRLLKQSTTKKGYKTITTRIGGRGGITKGFRVHRLVAEAFIPNPENKPEVNHINSLRDDNRVLNLEWVTPKENTNHAISEGNFENSIVTIKEYIKQNFRELNQEEVRYIRKKYTPYCRTFGGRALGRRFGVNKNQIISIATGKTYKDIL